MDLEPAASSVRVTEVEYPVDVDDLIADCKPGERVTFSAVGGWAVVTSSSIDRALLFSIASGANSDALSLSVPPSNLTYQQHSDAKPFSLCTWVVEESGTALIAVGVAILSFDAVLRLYPYVPIQVPTSVDALPCHELRVDHALARSVNATSACYALKVSSLVPSQTALVVFGTQGSAALVRFDSHECNVIPIARSQTSARPSKGITSMFYSAIRTIASASSFDSNWRWGDGPFKIIDVHPVAGGVVVVRYGGTVERWNSERLLWSLDTFPSSSSISSQSDNFISSSAITSEGNLVLLLQNNSAHGVYKALRCYDVRDEAEAPATFDLSLPLDDEPDSSDSPCRIVVCSDIVYLFLPARGLLAWRSVARGIPSEGQVQGSVQINPIYEPLFVAEASRGLSSSSTSGVAACFHQNGVFLAGLEVPPPVSKDLLGSSSTPTSILSELRSILLRSFQQYHTVQKGAARVSLKGLIEMLGFRGYDTCGTLSQLIHNLSRDLATNDNRTFGDSQESVLIESGLIRRLNLHCTFLRMLSDASLFTGLRSDAPSIAEDRIWDAIDLGCRFSVLADHEFLAAATGIRRVENGESFRDLNGGFNDAASQPVSASREVVEIARALRTSLVYQNDSLKDDLDVLSMALRSVDKEISGDNDPDAQASFATTLYKRPFEIPRFIVRLEESVKQKLDEIRTRDNLIDSPNADGRSQHLDEACSVVSLGCEVSIAVLENTLNAHIDGVGLVAGDTNRAIQLQTWLHDSQQCISSLGAIAKLSLKTGQKCVERKKESIMSLAVLVIDKVLACCQLSTTPASRAPGRLRSKRRRLNLSGRQTEWNRILRHCLTMLIDHDLQKEAFRLAEKYKDFDTMMDLKVLSDDFNTFMAASVEKFGEDFGLHAFQWLEDRGKIGLLLQGRPDGNDNAHIGVSAEMEPVKAMLSDYFGDENKQTSNLSWMHWLAVGNVKDASTSLLRQLKHVSQPGRSGTFPTTHLLGSITKLALLTKAEETEGFVNENDTVLSSVTSQLDLCNFQALLNQDSNALMFPRDIVHDLVDKCDVETGVLSGRVSLALKAVRACESLNKDDWKEQDYVWRRCIDRQSDIWIKVAEARSKVNDVRLKAKLCETALFVAGSEMSLNISQLDKMLSRNFLAGGDLDQRGYLQVVVELIRTTVDLYSQAGSGIDVVEEEGLRMSL